ncbi:SRR1-like protein isoform X1 [Lemur catta]|uniref:SRR1-like protein isoform X1 n=1 Tax=Lemur catta TaxID=9447 RepID=UPI001E266E82|nr:SRR1-like protein isoform X1 [Lemur catta]
MAAAAATTVEPWQAAAPRRRRSAARRPRQREAAARDPETELEAHSGVALRRIREAKEDLLISDFWSSALDAINRCLTKHLKQLKCPVRTLSGALGNLHLDSPDESDVAPGSIPGENLVTRPCHLKCVCYGIGNFATCVIARNQLAFLLLLLEKCQIPRSHCWVYDPLFSQLEIAILNTLGVIVLSENEEGKRSVCGEPTIFYMLHCGTALYNNLLWSNWSADALSRMIVIGNSFRGLEERLLARILQKNYPYVAKYLDFWLHWANRKIRQHGAHMLTGDNRPELNRDFPSNGLVLTRVPQSPPLPVVPHLARLTPVPCLAPAIWLLKLRTPDSE